MERKIFWMVFTGLGLVADFVLPLWWGLGSHGPSPLYRMVGRLPQRVVLNSANSGSLLHRKTLTGYVAPGPAGYRPRSGDQAPGKRGGVRGNTSSHRSVERKRVAP